MASKIISTVSAIILVGMLLFPPFQAVNYKNMVVLSKYGFIFNPPIFVFGSGSIPATVNTSLLMVQIIAMVAAYIIAQRAVKK